MHALGFRDEGRAHRHAMVAVMHPQAAKADEPAARAFARRPAAEPQRLPLGLVAGDHGVAPGAIEHAVLQKIHHARIAVEYRQSVCIRHGDGPKLEALGDEVMTLQDGSLPVPLAGL
jgi:hypothetical protein